MSFRRAVVALGIVLTVSGLFTASAQAQGRGGFRPPYTPAAGAKDLRAVSATSMSSSVN